MIVYLLDIDGTLIHSHEQASGRVAFDEVAATLHGLTDASAGVRYGGKTDRQIVNDIFEARLGRRATTAETDAFLAAYLPRLQALLDAHGVIVLPGVVETLAYLRARPDVLVTIATGNIRDGARVKLGAGGLAFDLDTHGGYGCDSSVRAELVARGIERAKAVCDPREVIVVGDTIHDISAARACGATVVAVTTGSDSADALAHADAVLSSMAELPAWHAARFA